jgi:hypothetical protein
VNGATFLRLLHRERRMWVAADGAEVRWVLRGIDIAMKLAKTLLAEERARRDLLGPRIPTRYTGQLYNAIKRALDLLADGQKIRAVAYLKNVLAKVPHGH